LGSELEPIETGGSEIPPVGVHEQLVLADDAIWTFLWRAGGEFLQDVDTGVWTLARIDL